MFVSQASKFVQGLSIGFLDFNDVIPGSGQKCEGGVSGGIRNTWHHNFQRFQASSEVCSSGLLKLIVSSSGVF